VPYHVLTIDGSAATGNAIIGAHPPGMPIKNFEFARAQPLGARFPSGASYTFSADYPDARAVCDLQSNTLGLFIVSEALRREFAIESAVELLPLRLLDHRGDVVSETHALANFLRPVDCVDIAASRLDFSNTHPDRVDRIRGLVLDEARIPPERAVFRLAQRTRTLLVRDDLRKRIEAARLTGLILVPSAEFDTALHLGV